MRAAGPGIREGARPGADGLTLFLAGDALISEPWSHVQDPAFERLLSEMRGADVTLVNLETLLHEYEGYAQADAGGSWMASPPAIARELAWAGVDLLAHANNHAFDYGPAGILSTHEHVAAAGLGLAGSGRDLARARAPAMLACEGGRVALLAMTSTFVRYGRASPSRPDLHGRPGVNPLELVRERVLELTPRLGALLRRGAGRRGAAPDPAQERGFELFGRRVEIGTRVGSRSRRRPVAADARANLAAIGAAAGEADLTIASIHAHAQKGWLRDFAHAALAAGADIVFCHGPHRVRGIELVDGKPIFYGLGDFVHQLEGVERQPAEAYEALGLDPAASVDELWRALRASPRAPAREDFEGCAAVLRYEKGVLRGIRLLPLDLQFDAPPKDRGRPRWADPALGRRIIERIARRSQPLGTRIAFDPSRGEGRVE